MTKKFTSAFFLNSFVYPNYANFLVKFSSYDQDRMDPFLFTFLFYALLEYIPAQKIIFLHIETWINIKNNE